MNGMDAQDNYEMKKDALFNAISETRDEPVVCIADVADAIKRYWDKTEISLLVRELKH